MLDVVTNFPTVILLKSVRQLTRILIILGDAPENERSSRRTLQIDLMY